MRAYKEWWPQRACSDELKAEYDKQSEKAKQTCLGCPVKKDCLNYALLYKECGIWGGTTKKDRDRILLVAPQIYHLLRIQAIQAGVLEHRYTIDQYWEAMRAARKAAGVHQHLPQPDLRGPEPSAPVLTLEGFEELLAEWSTL